MRPLDRLPAVTPETAIIEALEIMDQEKVNELPIEGRKDRRIHYAWRCDAVVADTRSA